MDVLFYIFLLVAPVAAGALLPGRWSNAFYGWAVLGLGLLMLDHHSHSAFERDDMFGLGEAFLALWSVTMGVSWGLRRLIDMLRGPRPPAEGWRRFVLAWEFPAAILGAVCFLHWLSNRMAGFAPAWWAHVAVAGAAAALFGLLWWWRAAASDLWRPAPRLGLAFFAALFALVLAAAGGGRDFARRAHAFAGADPYCLLTFAGNGRPRRAANALELSPLVNRAGGRHAVDREYWLVVRRPDGVTGYRWRWSRGGYFESLYVYRDGRAAPVRRFACLP